jgi:hypothetical protein
MEWMAAKVGVAVIEFTHNFLHHNGLVITLVEEFSFIYFYNQMYVSFEICSTEGDLHNFKSDFLKTNSTSTWSYQMKTTDSYYTLDGVTGPCSSIGC